MTYSGPISGERHENGSVHYDRCRGTRCPCFVEGLTAAEAEHSKAEVYSAKWSAAESKLDEIRDDLGYLKDIFEGNVAYPQNGPLASAVRRLTAHAG